MSGATITPDSLRSHKESTAANLTSLFPTTPRRHAPNSAKKRKQMADLSRPFATPGHGAKMSTIFRNAATSLKGSRLVTHQPSSNMKKSRSPFTQARSTKPSSSCQDHTTVSSILANTPKMSHHSGESCEYRASGTSPHCPTPTPSTKAGHATIALTDRSLGLASSVRRKCLDGLLGFSSASSTLRIEGESREPISSGCSTPTAPTPDFVENPEEVKYPILDDWRSPRSSSNAYSHGSDSDDLHSTHGVPFVLRFPSSGAEEAPRADIDTWLNGILEVPTTNFQSSPEQLHGRHGLLIGDAPFSQSTTPSASSPVRTQVALSKFDQAWRTPSRASSDKENTIPSKFSSPSIRPPAQRLRTKTPSRFCWTDNQPALQNANALHYTNLLKPPCHRSLPPQREKSRVDDIASSSAGVEMPTAHRDFTINEDHISEALAQLSPDVERHRKGRGPKKERCMSYWDEDILQTSPIDLNGHGEMTGEAKALRESKQAVRSTTSTLGLQAFDSTLDVQHLELQLAAYGYAVSNHK